MRLLLTILGLRALTNSKGGVLFLFTLAAGIALLPLVLGKPHATATGFVSIFACLWLVRRYFLLNRNH